MNAFLLRPRYAAWCIVFLLFAGNAFAQNCSIRGTVSDSATQNSISGVIVRTADAQTIAITDAFGNFCLQDITAGKQQLVFTLLGYKTQIRTVEAGTQQPQPLHIQLVPKTVSLAEVVIAGQNDLGQSMNAITQVDKVLRPTNSAQDLLRLVPGLFIAQHAGGGKAEQIFLRGFDSDHGTDFSVNIDGMPVNMVSHAHGQGYADFHFVIPEVVDRLNVYKGPYTARFGNFATSGAGEFITRDALDKSELRFEYGQFDTYRGLALVDLLGKKHLLTKNEEHAYLAAEYVFSNSYFESPQNFKRYNIFGKYTGMLNDRTALRFSASTFSSNWDASGQIPERAVNSGLISRFGSIDNTEGGNTGRSNANLSIISALQNGGMVKNQFYYSHYIFNLYSNFTFFLNDSINGDGINQNEKGRDIIGYNGSIEKNYRIAGKAARTTAGAGLRADASAIALLRETKRVTGDTLVYGNLREINPSLYIDQHFQLTSKLALNAALRYDYFVFGFTHYKADSLSGQQGRGKMSPKLNVVYDVNPDVQLFVRSGLGFHSNDSRAVVSGEAGTSLPRASGAEAGTILRAGKKILFHAAFWTLDLQSELVYVGDEGIVEISGATRRFGTDVAVRWEITPRLFADADFNYNHGRFKNEPEGANYIPLAPAVTSTGGLTWKQNKGWNAALRYRFMDSRPANETNTVRAKGYTLLDAVARYNLDHFSFSLTAENLLNTKWNEAQFDTESRLPGETAPVSELHFTPGAPFFMKGGVSLRF